MILIEFFAISVKISTIIITTIYRFQQPSFDLSNFYVDD